MPDNNNIVNQNAAGTTAQSSVPDSPWNEPLPDETPKPPAVAGTLSGQPTATTSQPFTVPQNAGGPIPPPLSVANGTLSVPSVDSVSGTNPAFSYGFNRGQQPPAGAPGGVTTLINQQPVTPTPPVSQPVNADIRPATPPAVPNPPIQSIPVTPEPPVAQTPAPPPLNVANGTPSVPPVSVIPDHTIAPSLTSDIPPAPASPPTETASSAPIQSETLPANPDQPFVVPSAPPTGAPPGPVNPEPRRSPLSKLFSRVKKQPSAARQTAASLVPAEAVGKPRSKRKIALYLILGLIIILGILIYLTEAGILSIGLEKAYGAIGIENLWHGLPPDSEKALAKSLGQMKDHQQFKVKGTISLNLDKTIKNAVSTPLISRGDETIRLVTVPIKAILVTDTTTTVYPDTTANSSADTAASTDATATDSEASVTNQSTDSIYTDTSTTKAIDATVTGNFGSEGNEMTITISKPIGSQTIELKNSKNNLWVKSDEVRFSDNAEAGKWLLYNLASLSNESVVAQMTSLDPSKGYSAEGSRQANEKIDGIRCFRYSLESVELGDSLSGLGISADSLQNISGTVWIGVKDKLIHRLDLKITASPSSPYIQITLSMTLSDFDASNNFSTPDQTDVIDTISATTTSGQ